MCQQLGAGTKGVKMEFIQNLYNEIAKTYRVEIYIKNILGGREVITTYSNTLEGAIGEIADAKNLSGSYFESGRIFDDCGVNVYEIDYSAKASFSMMNF